MRIKEILKVQDHRPWDLPTSSWQYYQEWNRAIFLHWEVSVEDLRDLVPEELTIDLFEGKAWVSLVAFTMEKIRPKYLPPVSLISNFEEINIRTYVTQNNKSGVYFLSMEGGKKLSCSLSKRMSGLPYRFSKIKRSPNRYQSFNSLHKETLDIQYKVGAIKNEISQLEKWLTERYALFQDNNNTIDEFEIHHIEWPAQELELKKLEIDYPRFNHLINPQPDLYHYSEGVKVLAWDNR